MSRCANGLLLPGVSTECGITVKMIFAVFQNDHVKTPMETELVRSQKDDGSYELLFKLENDGVYYGTVKYLSKMVGTESFTIICLEGVFQRFTADHHNCIHSVSK